MSKWVWIVSGGLDILLSSAFGVKVGAFFLLLLSCITKTANRHV